MSFLEATTSPKVLLALVVFTVAGIAEPFIEQALKKRLDDHGAFVWCWDYLAAPALRAAIIAAFVLCAYPAVYGIAHAPPLSQLLADDSVRINRLIGLLFLCTLLLPLVPALERRSGVILALQSLIATAAVFGWFTRYLGATVASPWPGAAPAAVIFGFIIFGHHIALTIGRELGQRLDRGFHTHGLDRVVLNATELLMQAPVILLYGYALGQQIAI